MPDSAPTSSTSHKAGPLHIPTLTHGRCRHRNNQRSSSFPIFLNPFSNKHHRPPHEPQKLEGYEVAPGIWSNEATAQVFGYLDDQRGKRRSASYDAADNLARHNRNDRSRSPSPAKKLVERYREAHADDGTDDFSQRAHRRHREEGVRRRVERREEARRAVEEAEMQTDRGRERRLRTVSREDTLVGRGANPRTGVVSPYATSESAGSGYITRGRREESAGWREKRMGRSASGRWLQDSHGWSLVESLVVAPIEQSETPVEERRRSSVPVRELQDKFVVNMPSASEPAPLGMSKEHIEEYQRSVMRAYRDGGGSHALVDPDTLPTPRVMTPPGPSTPPSRLGKIRRKEVGSAVSARNESADTVIINGQARAASLPTPRKGQQQQPRVRVISPGQTVIDVIGGYNDPLENPQDPFLGARQYSRSYPMNTALSQSHQSRHVENHHPHLQSQDETGAAYYARQQQSQTLSQHLPPVNLIHPHLASKPKHLSPYQIKAVPAPTAAFTTTTPTTTTIIPPRPTIISLDGSDSVPQANLLQGHLTESKTLKSEFHPARPAAYATSGQLSSGRLQREVIEPTSPERSGLPRSLVAGHQRLKGAPNTCMYTSTSHPYLRQGTAVLKQSGQTEGVQNNGKGRGGGREPFRPIVGNGGIRIEENPVRGGIVTMNGGTDGEMLRMKARANRQRMMQEGVADPNPLWMNGEDAANSLQAEIETNASSNDRSNVKVGESADSCINGATGDEKYDRSYMANRINRASSLFRRIQDLRRVTARLDEDFNVSRIARQGIIHLFEMTQHVLSTFNPASPAMKVLRKPDAKLEDYVVA
ncbi:MAG: hypothetical protein M1830_004013, partial [Pleopsidium flavum]